MVDDRPANILALEALLRPLGHRLVRAHSGEEALKHLLAGEFALILMDVQMPGMDGFETARLIKERRRNQDIPIIFITAISRDGNQIFKGYEHGAVDYLLKPFDGDILRSKVGVFIDLWLRGERIKEQARLLQEKERQESERRHTERFERLMEAMPACVIAVHPDGTLSYANRQWRELTGSVEASGLFDPAMLHPDSLDAAARAWAAARASGQPFELECRLRAKEGWRWHLGRAVPEHDPAGRVSGWIFTAFDIEEQKLAQQRERQARDAAEAANRGKDEFLAVVSHELRTPLNAILGWVRMLRTGMLDREKVERALETVERNAQAQTELIEDILDVSRIITGKLRLTMRNTDLAAVVLAAVDTVRPTADAKGVKLEARLEPVGRYTGDPDRLQQVVWNLLVNGIKFTPKGGTVEVFVSRVESQVEIRVRDSGSGITTEFLPYVFDRFRQADSASTRKHGGLGLGLAIVRHLVELHGGTIRADSDGPGKGSCFTVRLPVRVLQVAEDPSGEHLLRRRVRLTREEPVAAGPKVDLGGLRVLFVDDQPDARELVSELLRHHRAEVDVVGAADEAMRLFEERQHDVLLSDIGLPSEDGYSLIRRIRALPPERGGRVPAVAVTGFARAEDNRRALAEGFHVHLTKPVEPAELVDLLASLTGRATE
jgi:PAS domain S-box-containing protein